MFLPFALIKTLTPVVLGVVSEAGDVVYSNESMSPIIPWIIAFLPLIPILVFGLIIFFIARFLIKASKERTLMRIEMGKIAEEIKEIKQKL